jgi:hypothetical protein
MRDIIVEQKSGDGEILLRDVNCNHAVLAIDDEGDIVGMVIKESGGYITRKTNGCGSSGHHTTLQDCIRADSKYWDFITN